MNKQLLLIDDDFDDQDIFKEAVASAELPIKCFYASSAKQGIELLDILTPDFIFLDINMPLMNGFECLYAIKKKDKVNQIPVVMCSTGVDEKTKASALALGAVACIRKESSIRKFGEILKTLLSPRI